MKVNNLETACCGFQLALGVILLLLVTSWIIAHLFKGTFGLLGLALAATVWYIIFGLARISWQDYKQSKEQNLENEKD